MLAKDGLNEQVLEFISDGDLSAAARDSGAHRKFL
jgi:hypothetical protein